MRKAMTLISTISISNCIQFIIQLDNYKALTPILLGIIDLCCQTTWTNSHTASMKGMNEYGNKRVKVFQPRQSMVL